MPLPPASTYPGSAVLPQGLLQMLSSVYSMFFNLVLLVFVVMTMHSLQEAYLLEFDHYNDIFQLGQT